MRRRPRWNAFRKCPKELPATHSRSGTPDEKQRIVAEANKELTKAVTEQGLSVEEYTSILGVARDNPEIRDKLLQHIQLSDQ